MSCDERCTQKGTKEWLAEELGTCPTTRSNMTRPGSDGKQETTGLVGCVFRDLRAWRWKTTSPTFFGHVCGVLAAVRVQKVEVGPDTRAQLCAGRETGTVVAGACSDAAREPRPPAVMPKEASLQSSSERWVPNI